VGDVETRRAGLKEEIDMLPPQKPKLIDAAQVKIIQLLVEAGRRRRKFTFDAREATMAQRKHHPVFAAPKSVALPGRTSRCIQRGGVGGLPALVSRGIGAI